MRCLRMKKQVANTADIARREIKEIAIIDHAEFSKLGINHSSKPVNPAYFVSVSPDFLETKTACIFTPTEFPAIATKTPSSLSKTIAALNPAFCALLTLCSKLHPPLIINTYGELLFKPFSALLVKSVHASIGSAKDNTPHSPEPFIAGAKLASISLKAMVTLFPIKTTLADATKQQLNRDNNKTTIPFIDLILKRK